jgi:hypothetical protein
MSQEPVDEFDLAVAMLTLRVNTPAGEWLSDDDFAIFCSLWDQAEDFEALLLSMMNLAWYALIYLEACSKYLRREMSPSEWLRWIAIDEAKTRSESQLGKGL